jgi:RNA polymerase sigma-70 factor (ECF subfamily)
MLETTTESVTSALKRARTALHHHHAATTGRDQPPATGSAAEDALVAKFVRAYESSDVDALVELLTDDVFMSMPPMPFEYQGKAVVAEFWALLLGPNRKYRLVPTRANAQPAFAAYVRSADGLAHGTGLFVLTLTGNQICALTRFESTALSWFGLPRSLTNP